MYKNTIDLCRWILYPVTMLKLFINSKSHNLSRPTVDLSTHRSFFCVCSRVLVCSGGMAALGCWGGDQWLPIVLSKPLWTSLFLKRGFWVSSSDNLGGFPESCRRSQVVKTSEDGASPEFQTQSVPCGSCCCRFSRISNTRGKEAWEYVKKKKKKSATNCCSYQNAASNKHSSGHCKALISRVQKVSFRWLLPVFSLLSRSEVLPTPAWKSYFSFFLKQISLSVIRT